VVFIGVYHYAGGVVTLAVESGRSVRDCGCLHDNLSQRNYLFIEVEEL